MPNRLREQSVLTAALPHLGPFIEPPRHLDEENDSEFPGHTFDFVAKRAGGEVAAIEVTDAIDGSFRSDGAQVESWSRRMTAALRRIGVGPGTYIASTSRSSPPMKTMEPKITAAAPSLAVGTDVEVARDVSLYRLGRDDGQIVFAWTPGLGGSVFEIFVRLFSSAIVANTKKLAHAADCGFETWLLMTPEWLPHGPTTLADVYDAIRQERAITPIPNSILVVDRHEGTIDRLR